MSGEGEAWEDTEIAMREVLSADDARAALQFLQARGWRPPRLPSGRRATRADPIATLLDALDLAGWAVTALIRDIPEPDNSPVPQPVTFYEPLSRWADLLAPDSSDPQETES